MNGPSNVIDYIILPNTNVTLSILSGSILDFKGDAIVNAANNGGVSGFGVDQAINRAAGDFEIKEARKKFNGIPTGEAKSTLSYRHDKVKRIIHAVGPVYRDNVISSRSNSTQKEKDELLKRAYRSALVDAVAHGAKSVGFCLLSAGAFRGERLLDDIVDIAIASISESVCELTPSTLTCVCIFAFTEEEQACVRRAVERIKANK